MKNTFLFCCSGYECQPLPFWLHITSQTSPHVTASVPKVVKSHNILQLPLSRSVVSDCNPMDCSPPSSSLCEISQARILEWVAISSFRESSQPRDQTCNSCLGRLVQTQVNTLVKYEFGCCFFNKLRIMKIDFENLERLRKYIYSLFYVRIENTQNKIYSEIKY